MCVGSLRLGEILLSMGVLRGVIPVSAISSEMPPKKPVLQIFVIYSQ